MTGKRVLHGVHLCQSSIRVAERRPRKTHRSSVPFDDLLPDRLDGHAEQRLKTRCRAMPEEHYATTSKVNVAPG